MIVNKRGIADAFGVTEETITQWQKLDTPMPVKTRRRGLLGNEYEVADCIRWYANREAGGDGALDLNQERARLARAQADKTTLEAAELKGEMVRYEEISAHWVRHATDCKQKLLTVPQKVAPRVRLAVNDQEAAAIIEAEIYEALEGLRGDGVPVSVTARRERSARLAAPAGAVDGQPVGGPEPDSVARIGRRARALAH